LEVDGLTGEVQVYRDEYGIPTIIAENRNDLFFAQGYEYARDRLWQAEFFRALAHGELSTLLGDVQNMTDNDKFLRTLSFERAAKQSWDKTNPTYQGYVQRYVDGLNQYIDDHENNLPVEFQILSLNLANPFQPHDIKPKKWTPIDAVMMQGVMSYDLSFGGLRRELLRQDLVEAFGLERTLELMHIQHPETETYFLNLNESSFEPSGSMVVKNQFLGNSLLGLGIGSNSKIANGSITESGLPILANDPHLGLSTPGIWWQVHLYSISDGFHVEGYTLPGLPGIVLGHNENIAWGWTNTGTDAVDLFTFNSNDTHYFHDNQWKEFEIETSTIKVKGGESEEFKIKRTVYGPILNPEVFSLEEGSEYVMRWTLHYDHERNTVLNAIVRMNEATNTQELVDALYYYTDPGQNVVFGTTDGDIGYQFTGLIPNRTMSGSGILPQNGSSNNFGWQGVIPYEDQYRIINPASNYFTTANEKIDPRDNFYITDMFSIGYRAERAKQMMSEVDVVTIDTMSTLQGDVLDLSTQHMLDPYLPYLSTASFTGDFASMTEEAVDILKSWKGTMYRNSTGAMIYATFRIFLEEYTFKDEMDDWDGGDDLFERYNGPDRGGASFGLKSVATNLSSIWFDDVGTTGILETGNDIAKRAIESSVEFLKDKLGKNIERWEWGRLHKVIYQHPLGTAVPFLDFNEGNKASDGSSHTLKASWGSPRWTEDGPEFSQSHGPSMRFIAEVEETWSNVWGIVSPGESGNWDSPHRGDGVNAWINNQNRLWVFDQTVIEQTQSVTFTFKKK
jgi:penicillin amidase